MNKFAYFLLAVVNVVFFSARAQTIDTRFALDSGPLGEEIVNRVVTPLMNQVEGGPFEYVLRILPDDNVNASVQQQKLPGQRKPVVVITINKGLLQFTPTVDMLASVVAHEMAHYLRGHTESTEDYRPLFKRMVYSMNNEYEADHFGFKLLLDAGFSPQGAIEMFLVLAKMEPDMREHYFREVLSTHPSSESREKVLRAMLEAMGESSRKTQAQTPAFWTSKDLKQINLFTEEIRLLKSKKYVDFVFSLADMMQVAQRNDLDVSSSFDLLLPVLRSHLGKMSYMTRLGILKTLSIISGSGLSLKTDMGRLHLNTKTIKAWSSFLFNELQKSIEAEDTSLWTTEKRSAEKTIFDEFVKRWERNMFFSDFDLASQPKNYFNAQWAYIQTSNAEFAKDLASVTDANGLRGILAKLQSSERSTFLSITLENTKLFWDKAIQYLTFEELDSLVKKTYILSEKQNRDTGGNDWSISAVDQRNVSQVETLLKSFILSETTDLTLKERIVKVHSFFNEMEHSIWRAQNRPTDEPVFDAMSKRLQRLVLTLYPDSLSMDQVVEFWFDRDKGSIGRWLLKQGPLPMVAAEQIKRTDDSRDKDAQKAYALLKAYMTQSRFSKNVAQLRADLEVLVDLAARSKSYSFNPSPDEVLLDGIKKIMSGLSDKKQTELMVDFLKYLDQAIKVNRQRLDNKGKSRMSYGEKYYLEKLVGIMSELQERLTWRYRRLFINVYRSREFQASLRELDADARIRRIFEYFLGQSSPFKPRKEFRINDKAAVLYPYRTLPYRYPSNNRRQWDSTFFTMVYEELTRMGLPTEKKMELIDLYFTNLEVVCAGEASRQYLNEILASKSSLVERLKMLHSDFPKFAKAFEAVDMNTEGDSFAERKLGAVDFLTDLAKGIKTVEEFNLFLEVAAKSLPDISSGSQHFSNSAPDARFGRLHEALWALWEANPTIRTSFDSKPELLFLALVTLTRQERAPLVLEVGWSGEGFGSGDHLRDGKWTDEEIEKLKEGKNTHDQELMDMALSKTLEIITVSYYLGSSYLDQMFDTVIAPELFKNNPSKLREILLLMRKEFGGHLERAILNQEVVQKWAKKMLLSVYLKKPRAAKQFIDALYPEACFQKSELISEYTQEATLTPAQLRTFEKMYDVFDWQGLKFTVAARGLWPTIKQMTPDQMWALLLWLTDLDASKENAEKASKVVLLLFKQLAGQTSELNIPEEFKNRDKISEKDMDSFKANYRNWSQYERSAFFYPMLVAANGLLNDPAHLLLVQETFFSIAQDPEAPMLERLYRAFVNTMDPTQKGMFFASIYPVLVKYGQHKELLAKQIMTLLGVVGVKAAQLLSEQKERLPDKYREVFASFKENAMSVPKHLVLETFNDYLKTAEGRAEAIRMFPDLREKEVIVWSDVCKSVGAQLGSASIKIVYAVVLRDGRQGVLKILRKDIDRKILRDLANLESLVVEMEKDAELAEFVPLFKSLLQELKVTLEREIKFLQEVSNRDTMEQNQEKRKSFHVVLERLGLEDKVRLRISLPEVYGGTNEWTIEQRADGVSVDNIEQLKKMGIDIQALSKAIVREVMWQIFFDGFVDPDRHGGNFKLDAASGLGGISSLFFIDLGQAFKVSKAQRASLIDFFRTLASGDAEKISKAWLGMVSYEHLKNVETEAKEFTETLAQKIASIENPKDNPLLIFEAVFMMSNTRNHVYKDGFLGIFKTLSYMQSYLANLGDSSFLARTIKYAHLLSIVKSSFSWVNRLLSYFWQMVDVVTEPFKELWKRALGETEAVPPKETTEVLIEPKEREEIKDENVTTVKFEAKRESTEKLVDIVRDKSSPPDEKALALVELLERTEKMTKEERIKLLAALNEIAGRQTTGNASAKFMKSFGVESGKFFLALYVATFMRVVTDDTVYFDEFVHLLLNTDQELFRFVTFSVGAGLGSSSADLFLRMLERKFWLQYGGLATNQAKRMLAQQGVQGMVSEGMLRRMVKGQIGFVCGMVLNKILWDKKDWTEEKFWIEVAEEASSFWVAQLAVKGTVAVAASTTSGKRVASYVKWGKEVWKVKGVSPVGLVLSAVELGLEMWLAGVISEWYNKEKISYNLSWELRTHLEEFSDYLRGAPRQKELSSESYKFMPFRGPRGGWISEHRYAHPCSEKENEDEYAECWVLTIRMLLDQYMMTLPMWGIQSLRGSYTEKELKRDRDYRVIPLGSNYKAMRMEEQYWAGYLMSVGGERFLRSGRLQLGEGLWGTFEAKRRDQLQKLDKTISPNNRRFVASIKSAEEQRNAVPFDCQVSAEVVSNLMSGKKVDLAEMLLSCVQAYVKQREGVYSKKLMEVWNREDFSGGLESYEELRVKRNYPFEPWKGGDLAMDEFITMVGAYGKRLRAVEYRRTAHDRMMKEFAAWTRNWVEGVRPAAGEEKDITEISKGGEVELVFDSIVDDRAYSDTKDAIIEPWLMFATDMLSKPELKEIATMRAGISPEDYEARYRSPQAYYGNLSQKTVSIVMPNEYDLSRDERKMNEQGLSTGYEARVAPYEQDRQELISMYVMSLLYTNIKKGVSKYDDVVVKSSWFLENSVDIPEDVAKRYAQEKGRCFDSDEPTYFGASNSFMFADQYRDESAVIFQNWVKVKTASTVTGKQLVYPIKTSYIDKGKMKCLFDVMKDVIH